MKRIGALVAVLLLSVASASADEGMWLIQRLREIHHRMKAEGLKLSPEAIYDEASASLSDAVVAVDGGVGTGSMISDQGLMITNHHVAYSDICALSTPEHNYLEEGFWAADRSCEIPVEGKTVSFLRRVTDVTDEALAMIAERKAAGTWGKMSMRRLVADLEKAYGADTDCEVWCVPMWGDRLFLMYYYDVYRDVRLVGAPPVSIGSFGGDYDNWGWPQHKGDFALYRVYASPDGRPAAYSPDNVPLRPRRVLSVATGGVREGDYAMVIGFPGRTNRYASSMAIDERQRVKNPIVVKNRHERMNILRNHMECDPRVRMAYSDAYFGLSNFADLAKWENKCLKRFGVADIRRAEERAMQRWIESDPERCKACGTLLADLERGYETRRDARMALENFREAWLGPSEALLVANRVVSYLAKLDREGRDTLHIAARDAQAVMHGAKCLKNNYDAATDREVLTRMVRNFTASVPRAMWGEGLCAMYDRAGGDAERMAGEAFDASFCSDAGRYESVLSSDRSVEELRRDPLIVLAGSVTVQRFTGEVACAEKRAGVAVGAAERRYARTLYDFREAQGIPQYPNANSTMRLTYGKVLPLDPSDGVHYDARSTIAGYLEKCDPEQYEYRVDERMRELIDARDWGRWGEKGEMYVNFLTDNDITGGNSGSPVLDGRGRLIGLAFDGNRESMAGDVWFHPELSRTVCVDIRYVMWVMEKYAGAGSLLDEIRFEK